MEHEERREHEAKGGHVVRRARRKDGGEVAKDPKPQMYNAQGSKAAEAAEDEDPDFKKGGRKRKAGGVAEGHEARQRMDRPERGKRKEGGAAKREEEREERAEHEMKHGGREKRAAGGRTGHSPYSSGAHLTPPKEGGPGAGHEHMKVPGLD